MLKEWAKPSFSRLTTMLMSPWRQRVDVLRACARPPWRSRARQASSRNRAAAVSSMANSTNSTPAHAARGGSAGRPGTAVPGPAPQLVEHEDQRALPVDRDAARRSGPEAVVEDLEREQPVEAGGLERVHEGVDRQARPGRESSGNGGSRRGSPCRAAARPRSAPGRCGPWGSARIGVRSVLRARIWKESRTSPTDGWSARRTTSQASR